MDEYTDNQVRFYDLCLPFEEDIPFYKHLLGKDHPLVLEMGAGTGRISIPLASAGYHVIALDKSSAMIEKALFKKKEISPSCQDNLTLVQGDMISYQSDPKPNAVLIPANTFMLLKTFLAQKMCLKNIHQNLPKKGLLVLDLFNPHDFLNQAFLEERMVLVSSISHPKKKIIVNHWVSGKYDPASQVVQTYNIIETCDSEGNTKKYPYTELLRYLYRFEMELLLESRGFEVEKIYGWYDFSAYNTKSRKMIFVARKK
ncbi:MAG: class I SAM-dependent methyltransferase [Candidatus Brocadiae bacterium]|nr:class I SAM-dependent methyltransferase [Candidatus Brocadiia bacterium]